jgi:hypothetical protein
MRLQRFTGSNLRPRTACVSLSLAISVSLAAAAPPALPSAPQHPPTESNTARERPVDAHREQPTSSGLPDLDVRRDPVMGQINALGSLKEAPRDSSADIDVLRAAMPGSSEGLRVDPHPSGLAKQVVNFGGMLTGPAAGTPDELARGFLDRNSAVFGLSTHTLEITMENLDDASGVTFLKYQQRVESVPVFGSEVSIAVSPKGEVVVATTGQMLPRADVSVVPALSQEAAVVRAFEHCGARIGAPALARVPRGAGGFAQYANPLGADREEILAEKSLVNVSGEARLAFHVYVDTGPSESYETLVDANSGELLYRRNLYEHAQGTVFTENPTAGPRSIQSFAVNAANYPGTPAGDPWLTGTVTTGNNVDAYLDRNDDDLPDSDRRVRSIRAGRAWAPSGNFSFPFTHGKDPRLYGAAVVTNLFYHVNTMHDWMYDLGFTESARNFQVDNYGRGGVGGDPVKAEAQDGGGTSNANFRTLPEGERPRMQMYLYTMGTSSPEDDRDGAVDADIVFHEYGHGVSHRLIGNASGGLDGAQSRAMGEGWSDYWGISAFDDGVRGEYVKNNPTNGNRRTAYDGRTTSPNGSYSMLGNEGYEVHRDGEIWCQTLWHLREVLGADVTDRLVIAGMKVTPVNPSMLNARDGILAADVALGGANGCVIWRVFAAHGMGYSATGNDGTIHNAAFDVPTVCASYEEAFYGTDGTGGLTLVNLRYWDKSWDQVVTANFGGDGYTDLLYYDRETGSAKFYVNGVELRSHTGWRTTWDIIVPGQFGGNGWMDLLFYDRETGQGAFYTTDGQGGISLLSLHTNWRTTWDQIVPGSFGDNGYTALLFYDSELGYGEFYETDGQGGISWMQTHDSWNAGWDAIIPGNFGWYENGDNFTDLLFYDRETGLASFWTTDGQGGIYLLQTHTSWNAGWDLIVPGQFGGGGPWTDLAFYDRESRMLSIWASNGTGGIFGLRTHTGWYSPWNRIVAGDFRGDFWSDLRCFVG